MQIMKSPSMRLLLALLLIIYPSPISAFSRPSLTRLRPPALQTNAPLHLLSHQSRHTTHLQSTTENQDTIESLTSENALLKSRLKLLQSQNDELLKQQREREEQLDRQLRQSQQLVREQRLILEDFEGEGRPSFDAMGGIVDGWDKQNKRYTEPWDESTAKVNGDNLVNDEDASMEDDGFGLDSSAVADSSDYEDDDELQQKPLTPTTSEDDALCEYDEETKKWTNGIDECPVEPNVSFTDALKSRAYWLVGLLAMQSCSGFILARNEVLLQDHPVIIYFLTMLVGAGGNAGNQASVRVIRGLALGTLNTQTQSQFLSRELRMAFALSTILSVAGFFRAIVFHTPFPETMAVTCALSMIVFSSICLGAVLPLFLQRLGVDPAHSSTTIQVIMDILGVVLTVFVSTLVLDSVWGKMLIKALGALGL